MKHYVPAIVWGLIILLISVLPGNAMPPTLGDLFNLDKLGHLVFYGIFVYLLIRGYRSSGSDPKKIFRFSLFFAISAALYGLLLEFVQYRFLPDRYFDLLDIIANIIGCFAGLLSLRFTKK